MDHAVEEREHTDGINDVTIERFRPTRSIKNHTLTIKQIVEKRVTKLNNFNSWFTDMDKAFDSIGRTKIYRNVENTKIKYES